MTEEELKALVESLKSDVDGLKKKNSELIEREKEAKRKADEAASAAEQAANEAAAKSGDVEKVRTALEAKYAKELKALTDKMEAQGVKLRSLAVDGAIAQAIANSKEPVLPHMVRPLTSMFREMANWDAENGVATIEDKPITDYVTGYFKSKDGAAYLSAADTSGAGATGNTNATGDAGWDPKNIDYTKWAQFAKDNPSEATALAKSWGRPELEA